MARLESVPNPGGIPDRGRRMSLTTTEIAVLSVLKDDGELTHAELSSAVLGALDLLAGLSSSGYIECRDFADHPATWRLTDKGLDLVDGEA